MVTRGDFNLSAVDNDVNKHWQKVLQFRRRNPAVGAGQQTNLGADTYGRKFTEGTYSNSVVIRLNTQAGQSYTVNVSGFFSDGQKVMDGYDTSKTAVVSDVPRALRACRSRRTPKPPRKNASSNPPRG